MKLVTKVLIVILAGAILAWGTWISRTAVQAAIDNFRICQMADDIKEIKQDVSKLKEFFLGRE